MRIPRAQRGSITLVSSRHSVFASPHRTLRTIYEADLQSVNRKDSSETENIESIPLYSLFDLLSHSLIILIGIKL